jgi:hypothetical protein
MDSLKTAIWMVLLTCCIPIVTVRAEDGNALYPGVPVSSIYDVAVMEGGLSQPLTVFQSSCPEYQAGYQNMKPVDSHPLEFFQGRSINWAQFSLSNSVTVHIHVLDSSKVPMNGRVKIFPSRYGVTPVVSGDEIRFTVTQPGQYSVEIGDEGYKNGLLIFADPPETDKPDSATGNYYVVTNATPAEINAVPATYSGIYFKQGVHDIGVYRVPANIKKIYFEAGAWVYGAMVMDGVSGVKIFGRGVLSEAKLNYRESHVVEALHQSNGIDLEGIVLADKKFYAVRLLGTNNTVEWVKVVGGWTYNTDGIAAFGGSHVAHCFVWANDDSLKPYASDLTISDCVVWQLNNGAVIQLGWGNDKATNVVISNVDVLHAEWNNEAVNRGVLSCVGDKFAKGGMSSVQQDFLIENLVTETPVPFIFNIRPNAASPDWIHGMVLKNWNVRMDMSQGYSNYIESADAKNRFDGFVFDGFKLNGVELTAANWLTTGRFVTKNLATPAFANHP